MRNESYELKPSDDVMRFEFTSAGPKGEIPKLVLYQKTKTPNLFNLAFGDMDKVTGELDDMVVTNNNDSEKVLATVAQTIYFFTDKYSQTSILIRGSTPARIRLYQMGIAKYFEEISIEFDVLGYTNDAWYSFKKNTSYQSFLIKRKK